MQLEFAGTLAVADGRYLARERGEDGAQSVLVVETLGAPPPSGRRRRRPREGDPDAGLPTLPLARATVVRAFQPFDATAEAALWLEGAIADEEAIDAIVDEGVGLLNRALFAQAVASADPRGAELSPSQAVKVRIGYGSGDEVASGRFAVAHDVDVRIPSGSRRQRRDEEMRPQERVAALLGRREHTDACEPLLLRARADLDSDRPREAALQLRVGLEALLVELAEALVDPRHEDDMVSLSTRRHEAGEAANMALRGDLNVERERNVKELLEICERVLRRRRVLRG